MSAFNFILHILSVMKREVRVSLFKSKNSLSRGISLAFPSFEALKKDQYPFDIPEYALDGTCSGCSQFQFSIEGTYN